MSWSNVYQITKFFKIIKQFNERLLDFYNLQGRVSDNKILILTALKAEDQINDLRNQISLLKEKNIENNQKLSKQDDLSKKIIEFKDKIDALNNENNQLQITNSKAFKELESATK